MKWLQKPPLGVGLDFTHPLAQGLVGCWLFNEGSGDKVNDLSGNGNVGTLQNMAFPSTVVSGWNPGKDGPALAFNAGASNYVYKAGPTFNDSQGTACALLKLSTLGSVVYPIASSDEART